MRWRPFRRPGHPIRGRPAKSMRWRPFRRPGHPIRGRPARSIRGRRAKLGRTKRGRTTWTETHPGPGTGRTSASAGIPSGEWLSACRRRPLDVWVDVGVFCAVVGVFCDAVGVFFCFAMLGDWVSIVSGVITDGG
jgi:hypothetical protein